MMMMMIGGRFSRAVSTRLLSEKVTARITSNRQTNALLNYRCSASRADPGGGRFFLLPQIASKTFKSSPNVL